MSDHCWHAYLHNPYPVVELLAAGGTRRFVESATLEYLHNNAVDDAAEVVIVRHDATSDVHDFLINRGLRLPLLTRLLDWLKGLLP
ncbi:hypothetical protein QNA23_10815 [Rhodococcus erythropolis]|uniref:hypothetical protein n=1 Tax=Rhodococcus erythropolis TaxID=1833 RepID=UPI0024BB5680|nr:hypothetical protein [Rhodococcus erythropolis]MDJ0403974.1 hypothetical protein [Rhodococcus erythropolis]